MTPHLEQQLSRTLDFLRSCQQKGMMPTKREIMEHLGIKSSNTVAYYLDKLEKRGKIEREYGLARGIRLVECETKLIYLTAYPSTALGICFTCRKNSDPMDVQEAREWIENHKKKGKTK